jgi:hypothetical protein
MAGLLRTTLWKYLAHQIAGLTEKKKKKTLQNIKEKREKVRECESIL